MASDNMAAALPLDGLEGESDADDLLFGDAAGNDKKRAKPATRDAGPRPKRANRFVEAFAVSDDEDEEEGKQARAPPNGEAPMQTNTGDCTPRAREEKERQQTRVAPAVPVPAQQQPPPPPPREEPASSPQAQPPPSPAATIPASSPPGNRPSSMDYDDTSPPTHDEKCEKANLAAHAAMLALTTLRSSVEDLCERAVGVRSDVLALALGIASEHVRARIEMARYKEWQATQEVSAMAARALEASDAARIALEVPRM